MFGSSSTSKISSWAIARYTSTSSVS